jgi:arabinofuranosyltransferase
MRRFFPVMLIIIALTTRFIPGPRIIDDSYITYRYSRNILAGNGFTFNAGERVLGTTTPLYTIVLTGLGALTGGVKAPFPIISWLLNSLIDAASCVLLFEIGKKISSFRVSAITALIWSIAPFSVTFAIGGLETSLFVLLLLSTAFFYLNKQSFDIWLCASLMFLTRPDALIFVLPLLCLPLIQKYYNLYKPKAMILAAIPLISWLIFSYLYFGTLLPHSIAAKSVAYLLPENAAFVRLLQHFLTPFSEEYTLNPKLLYIGFITIPLFFIVGFISIFRKNPLALSLLIYPLLYFITFSIAHPLIFRWYLTPPLPIYMLILLTGAESFLKKFLEIAGEKLTAFSSLHIDLNGMGWSTFTKITLTLVLLIPLLFTINGWVIKPGHGNNSPSPEMAWIKLEELYRSASIDVLAATASDSVVAAGDVGVLGYYTGRTILDTVGLNSPIASSYYPLPREDYISNYAIPTQLILDQKPDLVIFLEVYGRNTLLKSKDFLAGYHFIKEYPTDIYGSKGLLIYKRND